MPRRRNLVVLLLAALLLAPSPAAATGISGGDARNDVPNPYADLVSIRVNHGVTHIEVRARTRRGGDPVEIWRPATRLRFDIDTAPGGGIEYVANLFHQTGIEGGFVARVGPRGGPHTCAARVDVPNEDTLQRLDPNQYAFRFRRSCVGTPEEVRFRVRMIWYDGPAREGPASVDQVPDPPISFTGWFGAGRPA